MAFIWYASEIRYGSLGSPLPPPYFASADKPKTHITISTETKGTFLGFAISPIYSLLKIFIISPFQALLSLSNCMAIQGECLNIRIFAILFRIAEKHIKIAYQIVAVCQEKKDPSLLQFRTEIRDEKVGMGSCKEQEKRPGVLFSQPFETSINP
jgi:hypothetical protein